MPKGGAIVSINAVKIANKFSLNKIQTTLLKRIEKAGCSYFDIDGECIVANGKPGYYVASNPTQHMITTNHTKGWFKGNNLTQAMRSTLTDLECQAPCGCDQEITDLTCAQQLKSGKVQS